jgi:acetolactate synthase-1/2/3 large subunit
VGVCFATSGPGATNLVTGLACAHMDSVPLVAVTGQVAREVIGKDAFQETDITGLTVPITKHNYLVWHAEDLPRVMKEAFYIARTGRPGPVLVDIPKDVFPETAEFVYPKSVDLPGYKPVLEGHIAQVKRAAHLLNASRRPVVLAGHGVVLAHAYEELRALAEKAQAPVVTTLLGLSSFPENHVLFVGMPGMHGPAYASKAINEADVLMAVGMRFDDRVTGKVAAFAPNAKIVHIDIDPAEIGKNVPAMVPIVGDVKRVLQQLLPLVEQREHREWLARIDQLRREHPLRVRETDKLLPQFVIQKLSEATQGRSIVVTGVGQHQMWTAQHYRFVEPNLLITSGGLGSMGYELPAAVGAQVGRPDKAVWSVAGDGGFQMTMYELATMVENNLPVKIAIINNDYLGMVRQWQEIFYKKTYVATHYSRNPDFVKLAEAFGMTGIRVKRKEEVAPAIAQAMAQQGPVLVDFQVEQEENVYPFIPPGMTVAELMEDPLFQLEVMA